MDYKLDHFDLLVDDILSAAYKHKASIEAYSWLMGYPGELKKDNINGTINRLIETKLIVKAESEGRECYLDITARGREIERFGGWINYVDNTAFEKRRERIVRELTRQKAEYDLRLAKWQTWLFWPVAILGLIGGVYSIMQIFQFFLKGE